MGKKNNFLKIIRFELVCLAVVSVIVFGLVRWSEERMNAAQAGPSQEQQAKMPGNITSPPENNEKITNIPDSKEITNTPKDNKEVTNTPDGSKEITDTPDSKEITNTPDDNGKITDTPEDNRTKPTPSPSITAAAEPEPTAGVSPAVPPEENGSALGGSQDMDWDFIQALTKPQSGEILEADGAVTTTYYMQTDPRWGSLIYGGEDTIAKYACGPTSMAIVVSSLTNIGIDPVQMSGWACDKGYWYAGSGSLHTIVNGTAKAFGLESEGVGNDSATAQKVIKNLQNGGMAVVLMGKGHFTKSGHFIVLRGITEDGKILVADCNSRDNTMEKWDMETLQAEAKYAADGGPFWIIKKPNTIE